MNAGRKPSWQLDLEAQRVSFYRSKCGAIVAIGFATESTWIAHWFPLSILAVKQLPRFRYPAFTHTGIVKPINFHGGNLRGPGKVILHPFPGPFVRPPVKIAIRM